MYCICTPCADCLGDIFTFCRQSCWFGLQYPLYQWVSCRINCKSRERATERAAPKQSFSHFFFFVGTVTHGPAIYSFLSFLEHTQYTSRRSSIWAYFGGGLDVGAVCFFVYLLPPLLECMLDFIPIIIVDAWFIKSWQRSSSKGRRLCYSSSPATISAYF